MASYELTFLLAVVGGGLVVFTCVVISQINNKL